MYHELFFDYAFPVIFILMIAFVLISSRKAKINESNVKAAEEDQEAAAALCDQQLATWALAQIDGAVAIRKVEGLPCGGFLVTYFNSENNQLVAVIPARPPAPKATPIQVAA